jgi:hypothetical protein
MKPLSVFSTLPTCPGIAPAPPAGVPPACAFDESGFDGSGFAEVVPGNFAGAAETVGDAGVACEGVVVAFDVVALGLGSSSALVPAAGSSASMEITDEIKRSRLSLVMSRLSPNSPSSARSCDGRATIGTWGRHGNRNRSALAWPIDENSSVVHAVGEPSPAITHSLVFFIFYM